MKISIKSTERNFNLIFPTSIFMNWVGAKILVVILKFRKQDFNIKTKHLTKLFKAVKKYKQKNGQIQLVEAVLSTGEKIVITI